MHLVNKLTTALSDGLFQVTKYYCCDYGHWGLRCIGYWPDSALTTNDELERKPGIY